MSDLSFVECVCGSEILRRGSLGEPVDTELLVAESEDDPGNLPAAVSSPSPRQGGQHTGVTQPAPEASCIHTLPGALTPQGCFAMSVSPADPRRINVLMLRGLMDISKGTAAQEKLSGNKFGEQQDVLVVLFSTVGPASRGERENLCAQQFPSPCDEADCGWM